MSDNPQARPVPPELVEKVRALLRERAKAVPFAKAESTWRGLFPHLSTDIPRIALAAWLANDERLGFSDPCWLDIIAPSGIEVGYNKIKLGGDLICRSFFTFTATTYLGSAGIAHGSIWGYHGPAA